MTHQKICYRCGGRGFVALTPRQIKLKQKFDDFPMNATWNVCCRNSLIKVYQFIFVYRKRHGMTLRQMGELYGCSANVWRNKEGSVARRRRRLRMALNSRISLSPADRRLMLLASALKAVDKFPEPNS